MTTIEDPATRSPAEARALFHAPGYMFITDEHVPDTDYLVGFDATTRTTDQERAAIMSTPHWSARSRGGAHRRTR